MRTRNDSSTTRLVVWLLVLLVLTGGILIWAEFDAVVAANRPAPAAVVLDGAALHKLQKRLARFGQELPDPSLLSMDRVSAYQEHARFTYAILRSGPPRSPWEQPVEEYRVLCIKPDILVLIRWHRSPVTVYLLQAQEAVTVSKGPQDELDVSLRGTGFTVRARLLTTAEVTVTDDAKRSKNETGDGPHRVRCRVTHEGARVVKTDVWVVRASDQSQPPAHPPATVRVDEHRLVISVEVGREQYELLFPDDGADPGVLRMHDGGGWIEQPLPAGVLPHGEAGANLIARWDRAYAPGHVPPWDTGRPDSHLRRAVESGQLKPCSVIEFGCGSGTNAIYLAGKGFDVTGLDLAPRAIAIARRKAQEAGVRVRFYVADVLHLPEGLPRYDLVFDRGCYHGVRRFAADGYVSSLLRVTGPGSLVFILAGNANEERHYGPPRVTEAELVGDFAKHFAFVSLETVRFDTRERDAAGALGWRVLLQRRHEDRGE